MQPGRMTDSGRSGRLLFPNLPLSLRRDFARRLGGVILLLALLCSDLQSLPTPLVAQVAPEATEQPVILLPIAGAVSRRQAQLSGMAWYGENLILLPQYPAGIAHHLFVLPKTAIVNVLTGASTEPLRADVVRLFGAEPLEALSGFEGFETIAFVGDRVYLTIETKQAEGMVGYLTTGVMLPDLSGLRLYPTFRTPIPAQTSLINMTDEALVVAGDEVLTFYEANGRLINAEPVVHRFDAADLQPLGVLPMAHLDFRLTDATPLDADNRFWVMNYFYPGDNLKLGPDPLAVQYGVGPTHRSHTAVERLVQMELTDQGVELVPTPPIQLQLAEAQGRNWEGIVRLEAPGVSGFLLVTDKNPRTLLAFVPDP
jgi:hypothetical protein